MLKLEALINHQEPALPLLREWSKDPSGNGGTLLPRSEIISADTLQRLQVTTRSMLGTVVYETGGVSIANGLIRLLGSGEGRSLQKTHEKMGLPLDGSYPDVLMVADDILGGLFALNGGRFGPDGPGQVFWLAADDIVWIPLNVGYADFVSWCLTGDLKRLYEPFSQLKPYGMQPRPSFDAVYSFYPFLWTKEAKSTQPDIRVIDAEDSLRLRLDLCGFATD
jgi:hypothetical protein